jgi:hypothetical protein
LRNHTCKPTFTFGVMENESKKGTDLGSLKRPLIVLKFLSTHNHK